MHVQSHFQPLPTKLFFGYLDCGSHVYKGCKHTHKHTTCKYEDKNSLLSNPKTGIVHSRRPLEVIFGPSPNRQFVSWDVVGFPPAIRPETSRWVWKQPTPLVQLWILKMYRKTLGGSNFHLKQSKSTGSGRFGKTTSSELFEAIQVAKGKMYGAKNHETYKLLVTTSESNIPENLTGLIIMYTTHKIYTGWCSTPNPLFLICWSFRRKMVIQGCSWLLITISTAQ